MDVAHLSRVRVLQKEPERMANARRLEMVKRLWARPTSRRMGWGWIVDCASEHRVAPLPSLRAERLLVSLGLTFMLSEGGIS